jgi:hypothetical protein
MKLNFVSLYLTIFDKTTEASYEKIHLTNSILIFLRL